MPYGAIDEGMRDVAGGTGGDGDTGDYREVLVQAAATPFPQRHRKGHKHYRKRPSPGATAREAGHEWNQRKYCIKGNYDYRKYPYEQDDMVWTNTNAVHIYVCIYV